MSFPRYPKYKPSGVEWLGDVPEGWEVAPAKYWIKSASGGTSIKGQCANEAVENLYPGFSASGQDIWLETYDFNIPGVVLSAVGARCGKTFKADGSWGVVANTHCLFPTKESDRDFIWYLTNQEDWWEKGGSAQPFVKVSDTLARKSVFPPLPEQTAIAAFLDRETAKIDELVAEQRLLMELLKEKRQAVISHAVTQGLNPHAPMKLSGVEWLGDVPGHWEVKKVKFVTASVKAGPFGSALTKDVYVSSGFRVYGQEQVIPNDFTIGDYFITPQKYEELLQYSVLPGDILISCVGTFGKIAIVPRNIEPGIINPRLIRMRCSQVIMTEYLVEVMRSNVTFEQLSSFTRGGTMDVINIGTLSEIFLTLPPMTEQHELLEFIQSETAKLNTLTLEAQRAIDLLQERRTALISAAVTGQIDVRHT